MCGVRIGIAASGLKANLWFSVAAQLGLRYQNLCYQAWGQSFLLCGNTSHKCMRTYEEAGDKAVCQPMLCGRAAWIAAKGYPVVIP